MNTASARQPIPWFTIISAALIGTAAAIAVSAQWAAPLAQSLSTDAPGYWLLSRAAGLAAYLSMSLSVLFGLLLSSRAAKAANFAPTAMALHDFTALLGLILALFHALVLLGDNYVRPDIADLLLPFALPHELRIWIGLGQCGFYIGILIMTTHYLRRHLHGSLWRWIHPLAFLSYVLITAHGLLSGTDSHKTWVMAVYIVPNLIIGIFSIYRLLTMFADNRKTPKSAKVSAG